MSKLPKDMGPAELLEMYSHFNKLVIRSSEEQKYLADLRIEILERMSYKFEEKNSY